MLRILWKAKKLNKFFWTFLQPNYYKNLIALGACLFWRKVPRFGAFSSIGNKISRPADPAHPKLTIILTLPLLPLLEAKLRQTCFGVLMSLIQIHSLRASKWRVVQILSPPRFWCIRYEVPHLWSSWFSCIIIMNLPRVLGANSPELGETEIFSRRVVHRAALSSI